MGQNIESHAFALNSLDNDVDRAVIRLQQLKSELEKMYAQIEAQISSLSEQIGIMQLGSIMCGVFSVLPSIAAFAANAREMEARAITVSTAIFENLIVDELELKDIVSETMTATSSIETSAITASTSIETSAITATTATFENLIVDEMELEDIVATNAILQSFYLGETNLKTNT